MTVCIQGGFFSHVCREASVVRQRSVKRQTRKVAVCLMWRSDALNRFYQGLEEIVFVTYIPARKNVIGSEIRLPS